MVDNFLRQDYPRDRMEWIIIDDGTDKIEDLVKDVPCVKYYHYPKKMSLGKKRNLMHEKTSGEILVYMDDDDYYPPCRVSHAVETLQKNPDALCSGSSEIYIWYNGLNKMYQFGPYGPRHAQPQALLHLGADCFVSTSMMITLHWQKSEHSSRLIRFHLYNLTH